MTANNYEASVLFKRNYQSTAHIVINQGGTSSGKTYAIEQVLFCLASEKADQVITVVGQDIPNLKAGALRDALNLYNRSDQLKTLVKNYNKTDRIFQFHNGSLKSDIHDIKTIQDSQSRVNEIRLKVLENNVAVLQQQVNDIKNERKDK
ncbi:hypothetical protein FO440_10690 [Mucilaginibacter corticis]|uniref:Uncharacterized protein n=1 Tax=Mucilaginibacter corticis TaxID=2597670 RepID=A0A556MJY6_9SPHI|nr:hypothetical protein [Mucilaginibacter corticis]TSJ40224.1 hypothetical protein FO440_10690 [Mucilaginibacter corticis]